MPVAFPNSRVHTPNGSAFLTVYVDTFGDRVGWYVNGLGTDIEVYAIPGTNFYAWTTEEQYLGYYANAIYAKYVQEGRVMAALDYAVVFVDGTTESKHHFRTWADRHQGSVIYVSTDGRGRDVYQVKSPMSFQVLLLQAAHLMCLVDLV